MSKGLEGNLTVFDVGRLLNYSTSWYSMIILSFLGNSLGLFPFKLEFDCGYFISFLGLISDIRNRCLPIQGIPITTSENPINGKTLHKGPVAHVMVI